MEKDTEGELEKVVELHPAPPEQPALTPTQLEAIRLFNEASLLLSKMAALVLREWGK